MGGNPIANPTMYGIVNGSKLNPKSIPVEPLAHGTRNTAKHRIHKMCGNLIPILHTVHLLSLY
jgi:hypothetical protein